MRPEEFYNKLHTHLNGQQWEAVCSTDGPILLLAVPHKQARQQIRLSRSSRRTCSTPVEIR